MISLNILHISNDYSGSSVYKNLIMELDQLGISQTIYNPIREASRLGENEIELKTTDSRIIYSHILNKTTDRIFYLKKLKKIARDIEKNVDLSKIKLIHAHTWYSDGGVANLLSRKYDIPYIVSIRNTDLNLFQKWLIHLRPFGKEIIRKSRHVILISASYRDRILKQNSLQSVKKLVESKLAIIPNGVDPFWIENAVQNRKVKAGRPFRVLFVGKFTKNKNAYALQEAVKLIDKNQDFLIQLQLVGEGGKDMPRVLRNVKKFPNLFKYHGRIHDKDILRRIFQSCDVFAMPSFHETFGLVYIEAMLQGLPIMYRQGEGIDGFYSGKIGEVVTKANVGDIQNSLKALFENYNDYEINIPEIARNHDWRMIAHKYKEIYLTSGLEDS